LHFNLPQQPNSLLRPESSHPLVQREFMESTGAELLFVTHWGIGEIAVQGP